MTALVPMWPYADADDLARFLDALADLDPPPICWLSDDASDSFCLPCAEIAAKERGAEIEGGYPGASQESDTCEHCERCGCLLNYSLTEAGRGYELNHFALIKWRGTLGRDDAFHMARMVQDMHPDDNLYGEIVAVVERAVVEHLRMQS